LATPDSLNRLKRTHDQKKEVYVNKYRAAIIRDNEFMMQHQEIRYLGNDGKTTGYHYNSKLFDNREEAEKAAELAAQKERGTGWKTQIVRY